MTLPILDWEFPLCRPHEGVALGNGNQGVLVWGDDCLYLTVAKAGFWDRRGGTPFTTNATFGKVRSALESGDHEAILEMFAPISKSANWPDRPQQVGGARIEIRFADGSAPVKAKLHLERGVLEVELQNENGGTRTLELFQDMGEDVCVITGADDAEITVRPSWEWVSKQLGEWGVVEPQQIEIGDGGGFVQTLPADESLALVWRKRNSRILISTAIGETEEAAKKAVTLARALPELDSAYFWKGYWRDVPKINLPDEKLMHFWYLALWKQAGMTTPHAEAATLQGPWMEEYQLPPWSNDYHFNINVQLIYYPALMTNRLEHFWPLWEMILEWLPTMQENGAKFFGNDKALMLPHAVDDECHVVGTFWTGTIDHACTAWVAQMAWLHYRYGLESRVLKEVAWPLLNGAFEGFWAMKEDVDGRYSLPVSVSPEYRASGFDAWGRDASFQLAAWHCVTQILPKAAAILGEPLDPRWKLGEEKLPPYTTIGDDKPRIALWEGLELEKSHRHHSHLGGIWPFQSFNPHDEEHWDIVRSSLDFWIYKGSGMWSGWCLPWASILCSRVGYADAAVAWLHWLLLGWTNNGYGTRHNANFPGITMFDDGRQWNDFVPHNEVMQMDATMGFLIAACELLVQSRGEEIRVLPRIPEKWRNFSFDGIRCEGAFLVGATVKRSKVVETRVTSEKGGKLRLKIGQDDFIEREMSAGETLVF
jgi:alpha-L-fucosidase 2